MVRQLGRGSNDLLAQEPTLMDYQSSLREFPRFRNGRVSPTCMLRVVCFEALYDFLEGQLITTN